MCVTAVVCLCEKSIFVLERKPCVLEDLIIVVAVAVVICAIFALAQRRSMSRMRESVEALRGDSRIRHDIDQMREELIALTPTPKRLDDYSLRLEKLRDDLGALQTSLPHTNEVSTIRNEMQTLCDDFSKYKTTVEEQINKFTKSTSEDFNATREQLFKDTADRIEKITREQLSANSISREEFDLFKAQVEKSLGADEVAHRMETLRSIFDSTQIRTLNWQCKLISLMRGGLAPDAEKDVMTSNGIPPTTFSKFLGRLVEHKIVEKKSISAYYMTPDNEWIYGYVENADWLQARLEATPMEPKEKDYQQFVKDNLERVEAGLVLTSLEYTLATGRIDIMCVDSQGRSTGLELKYPAATVSDFRQIAGYKNDYLAKTDRSDSRFFIIAPSIAPDLRRMLEEAGLEWREIDME